MSMQNPNYDFKAFGRQAVAHAAKVSMTAARLVEFVQLLQPIESELGQEAYMDTWAHDHADERIGNIASELEKEARTLREMCRYSRYPSYVQQERDQRFSYLIDGEGRPIRNADVIKLHEKMFNNIVEAWAGEDPEQTRRNLPFQGQVEMLMQMTDGLQKTDEQFKILVDAIITRIEELSPVTA